MRRIVRENGLTLALLGLFLLSIGGQSMAGWRVYSEEQREHGEEAVGYVAYLGTGAFVESVFENWESEFLQMGVYVLLTAFLYQKGSPESRKLDGENPQDEDPRRATGKPDAPAPARYGGVLGAAYGHSLTIALLALFAASFALHAAGGARDYSEEQLAHGGEPVGTLQYLASSRFWFESLQNWQSEFLAMVTLVVLSIVLRQRGSPQSKPVAAPHAETGTA